MKKTLFSIFIGAVLVLPQVAFAQSGGLETSAWIPYWRSEAGVASALRNLDTLTEVNPFFYTVKQNGVLFPNGSLADPEWATLRARARTQGVRFVPTVMWANADAIDATLRDPTQRQAHIRSIAREVYAHDLDGIDIDYEAKYARTRPYFSLFLKELAEAIGYDRWVMCTIESRTPLDSRYSSPASIPSDIEYSNDFVEINRYCDRVRIMAYDQGRFDLKLNDANADPYAPVADVAWVEKVMRLVARDIDVSKLAIGVPTYGYEYDTFINSSGNTAYSRLWSLNPGYGTTTASEVGASISRSSAGELFFTYPATKSPDGVVPLPLATRFVTWSDDEAIRQKAALAQQLGLRGISVFKVDGGEDDGLWNVLSTFGGGNTTVVRAPVDVAGALMTSASSGLSVPQSDLEFGAREASVRQLQQLLNAHGSPVAASGPGSSGQETTFFGPATQAALKDFQRSRGITPAVGYYGPKTRAAFELLQ